MQHMLIYQFNNFNSNPMSQVAIDPQTIYLYNNHRNIPWNIPEYQPVRQYLDTDQIKSERQRNDGQKVDKKVAVYVTKKNCFIDEYTKLYKGIPPPCQYDFLSQFDQNINKKLSRRYKIDQKLRKNSYLQQIERKAKLQKSPGVGQYSLKQSISQSKSKIKKIDEKRYFYQDSQFLSTAIPGSGCYFPHQDVPNVKKERTDHKYWIDKHNKANIKYKERKRKEPDPGTYRALSAQFNSFDKMKVDHQIRQKKNNKKPASHGFGSSDTKFQYSRTKKAKLEVTPDPCNYNTMIEWKGKGQDAKKNNWVRCLSAGPKRNSSVYH